MKAVVEKEQRSSFKVWQILGAIWLVGALCDRIWLALNRSVPSWDPTNHLTGSLNYLNALQQAQWFSGEWWQRLWMLSSKYPPLLFISTAPFQQIFGTGPEQALLVNLLFSAILLVSVYGLGKHLFNRQVGLWAAALCMLLPRLYTVRIHYMHDYPLTALVAASFCCLTIWRDAKTRRQGWFWAIMFGVCFGLAIMVKQTVLFFIFVPLLWLLITNLRQRAWGKIVQLIAALLISVCIFGPWYRTNWIYLFSSYQNAIVVPGTEEGDPPLNTLAAWTYYWNDLPRAVSWPLLLVPLVGLLLSCIRLFPAFRNRAEDEESKGDEQEYRIQESGGRRSVEPKSTSLNKEGRKNSNSLSAFCWLALFLIASYFICSANFNKDTRYIMPYLPVLCVILAYGLTVWPRRLRLVRWGTVGLAFLLMCLNLFPIGGIPGAYLAQTLSPKAQMYPYLGAKWPHPQVVEEISRTTPQLKATVGVLPRIPELNHNNFNYYGALQKFQVYGREVGTRKKFIPQDARSLSWFLTKTGNQGAPKESQVMMVQTVEQSPDFQLQKIWSLPDGSRLKLYHRIQPPVQVRPFPQSLSQVKLERVTVPPQAPPGVPIPVTYEWSGPWEQLKSGIVLLTWKRDTNVPPISDNEEARSTESGVKSQSTLSNPQIQPSAPNPKAIPPEAPKGKKLSVSSPVTPPTSGQQKAQATSGFPLFKGDGRGISKGGAKERQTLQSNNLAQPSQQRWLHDHGIGLGELYSGRLSDNQQQGSFQVIETTAMLPPADVAPGTYTLEATYLNRETGENYPIAVPPVTLNITPNAPPIPAPEVDLVTQMRTLAANLPEGRKALDRVFDEIGRINQYDPVQDYTIQAERALEYRLQQEPQNKDWAYGLAFSNVLQKDPEGAIAALKRVVQLDAQNPFAHAYLTFLYLYQWRGRDAQNAIAPALKLNPNIPEVQALSGAAALMQGNVFKAWQVVQGLKLKL
ncbi:MAG: phospholipid carrier-dependent glycosyltransferase [Cyanobacteriota bacterium]